MSVSEFIAWKNSEEFQIWFRLMLCGDYFYEGGGMDRKNAKSATMWDYAYQDGVRAVLDQYSLNPEPFDTPAKREEAAIKFAESKMVAEGVAPPHWYGTAKCLGCGTMPCSPELDGMTMIRCPWCDAREHTDHVLSAEIQ